MSQQGVIDVRAPAPRARETASGLDRLAVWGFPLYAALVVYGSLVPFDYRALPLEEAWARFQAIPYLDLGVGARGDWVANFLLYVPLGFFAATFGHRRFAPERVRVLALLGGFVVCAALAVAVEFVQIFFAPRTVSLNDLIAELLGVPAGIVLWQGSRRWLAATWARVAAGGREALTGALALYALAYLGLALFPYDFLLSADEIGWKLATSHYGLALAPGACETALRCTARLGADGLASVPLGALIALAGGLGLGRALLLGLGIGLSVEGAQFFVASGVSQGASVAARALGLAAGAGLVAFARRRTVAELLRPLRWAVALALVPYVALLLALNGWFSAPWSGVAEGMARLDARIFIPFYFHYYTSEAHALASLIGNAALYGMAGAGYFVLSAGPRLGGARTLGAVAIAGLLATVVEAGKIPVAGKHPDPTNVLIAVLAAGIAYRLAHWLATAPWTGRGADRPQPARREAGPGAGDASGPLGAARSARTRNEEGLAPPAAQAIGSAAAGGGAALGPRPAGTRPTPRPAGASPRAAPEAAVRAPAEAGGFPMLAGRALALVLAAVVGVVAWRYPIAPLALAGALALYAACLWRWPNLWLVVVPAALPVLDLAPVSGWFFVDEFDLLVLTTAAVAFWRRPIARGPRLSARARLALALYTAAYAVSTLIGLLPLESLSANAFAHYYSHYNALRVAKGLALALLLLPALEGALAEGGGARRWLVAGMIAGLGGASLSVVWERWLFAGLLDFESAFRATGLFSGMHVGGAYIDGYLLLALPFTAVPFLAGYGRGWRALAGAVFVLGLYALLVTFSRIDYAAFVAAALVLLLALGLGGASRRRRLYAALALVALAAGAVAWPVLGGSYMQARFALLERDLDIRLDHWREVLALRDARLRTRLLGMGAGSYPRTYFWGKAAGELGSYGFVEDEGAGTVLRLGGGRDVYVVQRIDRGAGDALALELRVRSEAAGATLGVPLCEKTLLYSVRCEQAVVAVGDTGGAWVERRARIALGPLGRGLRPLYFGLYNPRAGTHVDLAEVRLIDAAGEDRVANGDFAAGSARWFSTSDDHLAWHAKSLWLHLLFEQGWLGVVLFAGLLAGAATRLLRGAKAADALAPALLAAFAGFLVVGLVDSLLDAPRLALAFYLMALLALLTPHGARRGQGERRDWAP